MIEIQKRRSSIWITPYVKYSVSAIEKALSVYDVPSRRYTQFLYEFDLFDKNDSSKGILKIPRGIGIDFVKKCFDEKNILNYSIVDKTDDYPKPRTVEIKLRPNYSSLRDDIQKRAVDFLLNETSPQKFLSLDTGFGKTFCDIYYKVHRKPSVPSIIISKNLSEQWIEFITTYTTCQLGRDVELLLGSKILEEYTVEKGAHLRKHKASFYVTSIDTLRSFASRQGPDKLQVLVNNLGIGIKTFDEAHTNYILNNLIDINMQVEETIYLTATPGRSSQAEDRVFKKIFSNVPTHGTYTHSIKQYYFINKITFNSTPSDKIINKCSTNRGFNSKFYSEYIFSTTYGKAFVYGLIKDILVKIYTKDPTCRTLILLDWLKDIKWLHDVIEQDKDLQKLNITSGMYCSIITNRDEKEKQLDKSVIIGTLGSMSAGLDIPNLRVIIPFTTYSSPIIARQLLGRLRQIEGKAVYYFDIVDEGFPAMVRQRAERMKIFEPRAKLITEKYITFDDVISSLKK